MHISEPSFHSWFAIVTFALLKLKTNIFFDWGKVVAQELKLAAFGNVRTSKYCIVFYPIFEKFFGLFCITKVFLFTFSYPKASLIILFLVFVIWILNDTHSEVAIDVGEFVENSLPKEQLLLFEHVEEPYSSFIVIHMAGVL